MSEPDRASLSRQQNALVDELLKKFSEGQTIEKEMSHALEIIGVYKLEDLVEVGLVLSGHLMIEKTVRRLVAVECPQLIDFENLKIGYPHLIKLASSLPLHGNPVVMEAEALKLIYDWRNAAAHRISPPEVTPLQRELILGRMKGMTFEPKEVDTVGKIIRSYGMWFALRTAAAVSVQAGVRTWENVNFNEILNRP